MNEPSTREEFLNHLHDALNHLYNADQLRTSPLAELFGVSRRFDMSTALRKILVDAIEDIRPSSSEPDQSRAWRIYDSLYCCYVQQLNQQVVADQLSISPRQLRREQHRALEVLADQLWNKYNLDPSFEALDKKEPEGEGLMVEELAWLRENQPASPARLATELSSVLDLIHSLAFRTRMEIKNHVADDLPDLAIHPAVLNQLLVSLIGIAIQQATNGELVLTTRVNRSMIELELRVNDASSGGLTESELAESIKVVADLAHLSGCWLLLPKEAHPFTVRLLMPTLEQLPVLVVDDNGDSLELLKRFAAGSRYRLITTRDSDQIFQLAEEYNPLIIVLDIMMPKENGWMVLGRLKQAPQTRSVPVIICTILPQEKLALSLGASLFLKKPVTRSAFIQALDQLYALLEPVFS